MPTAGAESLVGAFKKLFVTGDRVSSVFCLVSLNGEPLRIVKVFYELGASILSIEILAGFIKYYFNLF
jgi:hypothetical protein